MNEHTVSESATQDTERMNKEHKERLSALFGEAFNNAIQKSLFKYSKEYQSMGWVMIQNEGWEQRRSWACQTVIKLLQEALRDLEYTQVLNPRNYLKIFEANNYATLVIDFSRPSSSGHLRTSISMLSLWPALNIPQGRVEYHVKMPWKNPKDMWQCLVYRAASKISVEKWITKHTKDVSKSLLSNLQEIHNGLLNKRRFGYEPGSLWLDEPNVGGFLSAHFIEGVKAQITKEQMDSALALTANNTTSTPKKSSGTTNRI